MAPARRSSRYRVNEQPSSPPSSPSEVRPATLSSDKENHTRTRPKRKSDQTMALNTPASGSSSGGKRRRLAELQANVEPTQPSQTSQYHLRVSQRPVTDYYDPDQDVTERREIRKSLRDLSRDLNGANMISISREVLLTDIRAKTTGASIYSRAIRELSTLFRKRTIFSLE